VSILVCTAVEVFFNNILTDLSFHMSHLKCHSSVYFSCVLTSSIARLLFDYIMIIGADSIGPSVPRNSLEGGNTMILPLTF